MTAQTDEASQQQGTTSTAARLLRLAGAAVVLLALSQTLWLWQTWPVRQLLESSPPATPVASGQ